MSVTTRLRNAFIGGLVVLVPIVITIKALWWLFSYLDGLAHPSGCLRAMIDENDDAVHRWPTRRRCVGSNN